MLGSSSHGRWLFWPRNRCNCGHSTHFSKFISFKRHLSWYFSLFFFHSHIKSYQEVLFTVRDHNWFNLVTNTFFAKNQIRGRRKNLQEVRLNFILASACFFYLLLKAKCKNCLCIINDRGDKFSAKFINSLCLDDDIYNGRFFYHQFLAITNYLLD